MKLIELSAKEARRINGGHSLVYWIGYYATDFLDTLAGNRLERSEWGRQ